MLQSLKLLFYLLLISPIITYILPSSKFLHVIFLPRKLTQETFLYLKSALDLL